MVVILTGLADEGSASKRAEEQLTLVRGLGMSHYSLRFVDAGGGVKNAMALSNEEIARLRRLHAEFEVSVSSLASPIGKVKLCDVEDGTGNRYVPFRDYLRDEVARSVELAVRLETRLIRGFSFYPPRDEAPEPYLEQAAEQLHAIAERCGDAGLCFGLEVEANLVGRNGFLEAELWRRVDHPALGLVFDGGNLVCQGYSGPEVLEHFRAMLPGLLWLHVKDYREPRREGEPAPRVVGHVAEDALEHFVPPDRGDSDHVGLFKELRDHLPRMEKRLQERGLPGVFLDLEPHLKGGGQFGGFSGPDGFGVAFRALCSVLDAARLPYSLVQCEDLRRAR